MKLLAIGATRQSPNVYLNNTHLTLMTKILSYSKILTAVSWFIATLQSEILRSIAPNNLRKKGYVRLREIPYKPADYDFLKTDTYPTRRWRGGELTPRW